MKLKELFSSLSPAVSATTGLRLLGLCLVLCIAVAVGGLLYLPNGLGFGPNYVKAILVLDGIAGFTVIGIFILNGFYATLGPSVTFFPEETPMISDQQGYRPLDGCTANPQPQQTAYKSRLPEPVMKVSGNGSRSKTLSEDGG